MQRVRFLLKKKYFLKLGGLKEKLAFGEDHDFIWRARISGMGIVNTGGQIFTSARKYMQRGWSRTTLKHLALTFIQAKPFWLELHQQRYL